MANKKVTCTRACIRFAVSGRCAALIRLRQLSATFVAQTKTRQRAAQQTHSYCSGFGFYNTTIYRTLDSTNDWSLMPRISVIGGSQRQLGEDMWRRCDRLAHHRTRDGRRGQDLGFSTIAILSRIEPQVSYHDLIFEVQIHPGLIR